jgi:hypothetical protein
MNETTTCSGTIVILRSTGERAVFTVFDANVLKHLNAAVGGYIEQVPYFTRYQYHPDSKPVECVAFCNEDGKLQGLPYNAIATHIWHSQTPDISNKDILVGDVAVVFGDEEFMQNL